MFMDCLWTVSGRRILEL